MKLVSGIVDSGFFAQSALSAEVATKDSLGRNISETYLTGVDLTPYQTTAGMTAYANSAEVTGTAQYGLTTAGWSEITGGGGVTGDFTLVEGNGIQLTDDPIAQTTTISVSGDYATNTQLQTVSGEITALIPSTAGLATEDWVTAQGYITGVDLTPYQTTAGMTAYQPVGDYATTAQLADKVDSSAIGIREASVNLVSSISGMRLSAWTADNASYASTAGRANRDSLGNIITATYITGVPDTYLQNTDLSTEDGKVTAISGIPLSAGGEVPEGVMVESGLEYNAVNEISGYNGSAIAQYGAEKQWLVHDDTLVHAANSAQYALGVNLSAVAQLLGVDETVLFETTAANGAGVCNLSESLKNFKQIKVLATRGYNGDSNTANNGGFSGPWSVWETDGISAEASDYKSISPFIFEGYNWKSSTYSADATFTTLTWYRGIQKNMGSTAAGTTANSFTGCVGIKKVIGIGRKL